MIYLIFVVVFIISFICISISRYSAINFLFVPFSVKLCGKEILFVINLDNENKNKLIVQNFFDEQIEGKIVLAYEGQYYKITPYIWLKDINIENVLNYYRSIVEKSLNKSILNDIIADNFNQLLLSYILAYDRTKDENYYEIAMKIANKLVKFDEKNHAYMINKMQLCRRKQKKNNFAGL